MPSALHLAALQQLRTDLKAKGIKFPKKVWQHLLLTQDTLQKAKVKVHDVKVPVTLWFQTYRDKIRAGILPRTPGKAIQTKFGLDYPELLVPNLQITIAR